VTGGSAVAAGVLLLISSPLYVISGKPPSLDDAAKFAEYIAEHSSIAITTKLVDTVYVIGLIVFVSGFRHLVRERVPTERWVADLFLAAGLIHASVVLVGDVLGGGAALDAVKKADPTAVRALTEGSLLAFGAIGFLLTALFLAVAAYAILRAELAWLIGWAGYLLAALNIAAVPAVYQGNDFLQTVVNGGSPESGLYSYVSAVAGGLYSVWLVVLGVAILRAKDQASGGHRIVPLAGTARRAGSAGS
jgi:hypothetical protein